MADEAKRHWGVEEMRALGTRHAELEARADLEGVMATLVAEPRYEFWPAGLRFGGQDDVRLYYTHLFAEFLPRTRGVELLGEWVSPESLAQEYVIELEVDGRRESHHVLGILVAKGDRLGGERVYAGERCMRLMLGPLADRLGAEAPAANNAPRRPASRRGER